MVTGAFVFHLGVKKLQYAALLDRDPQMLSLRNRKSIKTIRKTDSFSDVSLEPVLAFEKRKKFHAAMLCMIGGAGSFIFGLANVVGGVYSLMEERMRLYEASQQRELTDRLIGHLNNCKSTRALLKKAGTDIKFDWTSNESSYNPNTHTICIRKNLPLDQEFKEATLNLATAVNKQGIAHMQKQLLEGSLSREDYCFQRYKLYHTSLMTQSNAVHQCKEWLSSAISIEGYEKVEKTYVEMAQTMIKSKVKRTDNSALSTMDEAMQFIWNQVIDANWEENRDKEMAEKYENEWDRLYKAKYCQSNPSSHLC